MPRICFLNPFGTDQFDELVRETLLPSLRGGTDVEIRHLEGCPRCRAQFLEYTRTPDQEDWRRASWQSTPPSEAEAAFLLRPPTVEQVSAVARAGRVMPQKSTFFYPKLTSGLLFLPLD